MSKSRMVGGGEMVLAEDYASQQEAAAAGRAAAEADLLGAPVRSPFIGVRYAVVRDGDALRVDRSTPIVATLDALPWGAIPVVQGAGEVVAVAEYMVDVESAKVTLVGVYDRRGREYRGRWDTMHAAIQRCTDLRSLVLASRFAQAMSDSEGGVTHE